MLRAGGLEPFQSAADLEMVEGEASLCGTNANDDHVVKVVDVTISFVRFVILHIGWE